LSKLTLSEISSAFNSTFNSNETHPNQMVEAILQKYEVAGLLWFQITEEKVRERRIRRHFSQLRYSR